MWKNMYAAEKYTVVLQAAKISVISTVFMSGNRTQTFSDNTRIIM